MGLLNSLSNSLFGFNNVAVRPMLYDFIDNTPQLYIGSDKDVSAYLDFLVSKHSLLSVLVLDGRGRVVGRSSNCSLKNSSFVKDALAFLENGLPKTDFVYVRSDNWHAFYTFKDLVFAVEASDNVTLPELRAVGKDLVSFVTE